MAEAFNVNYVQITKNVGGMKKKKMKKINIDIDKKTFDALKEMANKYELSPYKLASVILKQYLTIESDDSNSSKNKIKEQEN